MAKSNLHIHAGSDEVMTCASMLWLSHFTPGYRLRTWTANKPAYILARLQGNAKFTNVTYSRYFGNWKHDTCIQKMQKSDDRADFSVRVVEPGDYRISLEYACANASKGRRLVEIGPKTLGFETLLSGEYDSHQPLMLIRQMVGVVSLKSPGIIPISVHPENEGTKLFWLRRAVVEPVR